LQPATVKSPRLWPRRLFLCFLHAIALLCLCWWWQGTGYTLGIETSLAEKSILLKRKWIKQQEDTTARFLFLDVSGVKKLVPREGRTGQQMITDRQKIADLLKIIAKVSNDQYQYIICDVLFDKPGADDASLREALAVTNKVIIPYTIEDGELKPPVFSGIPAGYVGYQESAGLYASDVLIKQALITADGQKSLPTLVFEKTQNKTVEQFLGLAAVDEALTFNNRIIDFPLRQRHLIDSIGNNKVIPLDDMLNLLKVKAKDTFFFQRFMAGKLIVIGDFEHDVHKTVVGPMPGSLILANQYLSLVTDKQYITWYFVAYLLIMLTILSWLLIYPPKFVKTFHEWCDNYQVGLILGDLIAYSLLLWIIVFVAFLFSDILVNAGIVSCYIVILTGVRSFLQHKKHSKQPA
jgi:hypothetical protein